MAETNIPIWDDNPGPISGSTPFKYYDTDVDFQTEGPQVAKWCARRLGYPVIDVELQSGSFYACFEEAINEYNSLVNQFLAQDNMLDLMGMSMNTSLQHRAVLGSIQRVITIGEQYAQEAGDGGNLTYYTGSITTVSGQQKYNLDALWGATASGEMEIRRVFHEEPPAVQRYFDPYAGTGVGAQYVLNEFGWGSYSPGISFVVMPIFEDALRLQAIEFNSQIRRSAYGFKIRNNELQLFPSPTSAFTVWFEYTIKEERMSGSLSTSGSNVISSPADIPYTRVTYTNINAAGRQWIKDYTLASAKEVLGLVRGKYQNIPIPGAEVSLDGDSLRNEGIQRKSELIEQLRSDFEKFGKVAQWEAKKMESEATQELLNRIPLLIYVR